MKYIDADKLIAEINNRLMSVNLEELGNFGCHRVFAYNDVKDLIASLQQEQPEVDLDKEIVNEWIKCKPIDEGMGSEYVNISVEQFDSLARHFYELGHEIKAQLDKEDLIRLICGCCPPSYESMEVFEREGIGSYTGGFADSWDWNRRALEKKPKEQLWDYYQQIKNS